MNTLTLDVWGHGESSVNWPDYSVAALGSDILTLIRHLQAGPALIVGTSMAAGASVWADAEAPGLIAGMVPHWAVCAECDATVANTFTLWTALSPALGCDGVE